jgi:hypothetical protein
MTDQQRGDGFEAHPPVDGLGCEGVTEPVGVHVVDPGDGADAGDDSVHGATVDGDVVVGEEPAGGPDVLGVGSGPVGEQLDDLGMEGDHAVLAELADWDAQPVAVGADAVTASAASSQSSEARRPVRARTWATSR